MDTKYVRYYKNFKPPPFAPTYRPTEDEFVDPIEFIEKIKSEAGKYGIVKIKPPKSFRPPFAIKSKDFLFTPRVQKLNEIDGLFRLRLLFEAEMTTFWELQGHDLNALSIDGKAVDFYKLSKLVAEKGGGEEVTAQNKWKKIGKYFGLASQYCSQLMDFYYKWVYPFERCIEEIEQEKELGKKLKEENNQPVMKGNHYTHSSKNRILPERQSLAKTEAVKNDSVDDVVCERCQKGDDEERLLLCEECNGALHTYCCYPPLAQVPEAEWRCYKCIKSYVKSIGDNFGFHESHQEYNLVSFADYANTWKRDYFRKNIFDTTQEEVEKEFWRKVADMNSEISVKYGADLSTSQVGSGFPVFTKGVEGRNMSDSACIYAKHPWNLNNMPILKGSVLSHIDSGISGMMVPWVYVGMCFATFCWHTEDHWTYSINYLHWGERKIWYGVPGFEGDKFDKVVNNLVPGLFRKNPDLLHHLTTMINPMILQEHGVDVYTVHQEPGEFVITFPHAYHSGYNEGLNCAEAVNFAPYDWLRLGRLCIADYARVHRKCVFSHDELVISMVGKVGSLDMPMKVALYEEIENLLLKEKKWLSVFPESKHRYERTRFELIHDDQRECVFCKSTLYLSALECKHAKLACLMHGDNLCLECEVEDFYVKYRYTMEELLAMKDQVAATVENYIKWKKKAMKLFNASEKPGLEDFREVLKLASLQQIPSCEMLTKVDDAIKDCENICMAVSALLFPKLRNNNKTTKNNYNYVMKLNAQVETLPCTLPENLLSFYSLVSSLDNWKKRADCLLDFVVDEVEEYDTIIEEAKTLIEQVDKCDIQFPEVGKVKKLLDLCHWLKLAKNLIRWRNSCSETSKVSCVDDPDAESKQKWKLKSVEKLVDEGVSFMDGNVQIQRILDEVHSCMKLGWNREFAAEKILMDEKNRGSGIVRANEIWEEFKSCDWLSMENLDELRVEIVKAKNIYERYTECKEQCDLTFVSLKRYNELCEQSFFMNGSSLHKEITQNCVALKNFMKKIEMIFLVPSCPSTLYNILCNSVGDEECTHSHKNVSGTDIGDWDRVEVFGSSLQLLKHLEYLDDNFKSLISELRERNMKKIVHDCCSCRMSKPGDELLKCCLCFCKTHASCAECNDFLCYLPFGYYLCSYCQRGSRPAFHEVEYICRCAPPSLAKVLVEFVLQRCAKAHKEATDVLSLMEREININPSLLSRLETCLLRVLSSVVIEPELFEKVVSKLPLFQKLAKSQLLAIEKLQSSKLLMDSPSKFPVVYPVRKRSRSVEVKTVFGPPKKRMRDFKLATPY